MKCENKCISYKVSIPMKDTDRARFKALLDRRALKAGAYVAQLIMSAVEQDEAIRAGKTQIDYDALQGR